MRGSAFERTTGHRGLATFAALISERNRLLGLGAVLVLSCALYLLTLPQVHSGDDLQYGMVIERAVNGSLVYHPTGEQEYVPNAADREDQRRLLPVNVRYLLDWPTATVVSKIATTIGFSQHVIAPIIFMRLVGGLGCILFFFLAMWELTRSTWISSVASAGLAFSTAIWTYSTHIDHNMTFAAIITLVFYLTVRYLRSESMAWGSALVGSLTLAILFNLTGVIIAATTVVGLSIAKRKPPIPVNFRLAATLGLAVFVLTLGSIVATVSIVESPDRLLDRDYWSSASYSEAPEWEVSLARDLVRGSLGLAKSQVMYPGSEGSLDAYWTGSGPLGRAIFLIAYGTILAVLGSVVVLTILVCRQGDTGTHSSFALITLAGLLLYSLFPLVWDPGYIKYWIVPILCWWMLAGIALSYVKSRTGLPSVLMRSSIVTLVLASLVVNLVWHFLPNRQGTDSNWVEVAEVLRASEEEDLFISLSGHPLDFHISFFTERDIVSLPLIAFGSNGDETAAVDTVKRKIREHTRYSGRTYVYGLEQLSADQHRAYLADLGLEILTPAWTFADLTVYEARPLES